MKGYPITPESFPLQMHWADQFVKESERSIDHEDIAVVAQTVLFYAGMQLEMIFPPASLPLFQMEAAAMDWLLAPEEDIVQASLERVPQAHHRLLQLSLYAVRRNETCPLSPEERTELRTYAGPYIRCVHEQMHRLAEQWFH